MSKNILFIGMDVHKESIEIAIADGANHEVRRYGKKGVITTPIVPLYIPDSENLHRRDGYLCIVDRDACHFHRREIFLTQLSKRGKLDDPLT